MKASLPGKFFRCSGIFLTCLFSSVATFGQFNTNGVVAHRTAWKAGNIPQNSIEGLQKAMDLNCYAAEIDVHLTRDNVLVVTHDRDYFGVNIENSNYEDLKGELSHGEKLLTFKDFIREALKDPDLMLWADLKSSKTDMARAVDIGTYCARVVKELGAEDRIEFIGLSFEALVKILADLPGARVLYTGTDKEPAVLKKLGFLGIFVSHKKIAAGKFSVPEAREAGLKVGAFTVDTSEAMREQLEAGVNFIVTNEPELLFEVMGEE